MTKNNWLYSPFIVLLSMWLGWTVLVDFFVVPTIFKTIPEFFKAGELGMALFYQLNNLELIVSSAILLLVILQFKKNKSNILSVLLALFVWAIVMYYFAFLTNKISSLTEMWISAGNEIGKFAEQGIPDIQQEHQYYHNLYRRLDTIKLIVITILLGIGMKKQDKWA